MAVFQATFYTKSIMRATHFSAIIPNDLLPEMKLGNTHYDRPMKTLYLLHGYSGNSMDWMMNSCISDLSLRYNLAVIMPQGDNSFYLNGKGLDAAYETFTGVELVDYTRKLFGLSCKKEDTFIGGLSMGGFGGIHTGLKYPETFGKMFGLSSALITNTIRGMKQGFCDTIADYDYYQRVFGDLDTLDTSDNHPDYVIAKRKAGGEEIQPIFLACGTEDFLLVQNRAFVTLLREQGVDITYLEQEGNHDWNFWNKTIEPAIKWLLQEGKAYEKQ
jgi:S-formylglutathione hydrolase FrmB